MSITALCKFTVSNGEALNILIFFFNMTFSYKTDFSQGYVSSNSFHKYSIQGMHRVGAEVGEVNSAKFITPEKLKETGLRQTKLQGYSVQCLDVHLGYGRREPAKLQDCSSWKRSAPSLHWGSLGMLEQQESEIGDAECSHSNFSNLPQCSLPYSELLSLEGERGQRGACNFDFQTNEV